TISWVVNDGTFNSATQSTTVIITAVDAAPVLAADASGAHTIAEAPNTFGSTSLDHTSGTLTFTDVDDLNVNHTVSTSVASTTWSGGPTLPSGLAGVLAGALSTEPIGTTGSGSGSIAFTFSAADKNFDFLAANQT